MQSATSLCSTRSPATSQWSPGSAIDSTRKFDVGSVCALMASFADTGAALHPWIGVRALGIERGPTQNSVG